MKQLFLAFFFSIFLITAIPFLCRESSLESTEAVREEEENQIPLQDRMDLAILHEFEITKDPATNTVPRERLILAKQYAAQLNQVDKYGNYTAGAIPGM